MTYSPTCGSCVIAFIAAPKTFDTAGPIDVIVYDGYPDAVQDRHQSNVLRLKDVRAFFQWIEKTGKSLRERFEELSKQARDDIQQSGRWWGCQRLLKSLRLMAEEFPIRIFKEALGEETYKRLIDNKLGKPGRHKPDKIITAR